MESGAAQTDYFSVAFFREKVARRDDVQKFTADTFLFRKIQCKKTDNLMF